MKRSANSSTTGRAHLNEPVKRPHFFAVAALEELESEKPFVFTVEREFSQFRLHVINGTCPIHARLKQIFLPRDKKVRGTLVGIFA